MSGSEPLLVFATGAATNNMSLAVRWRSGRATELSQIAAGRIYELDEAALKISQSLRPQRLPPTLFEDVSDQLKHRHQDQPFDDLARQPLLPKKLSQLGPGLAWFDLNGDGWEELVIGSGRGGQLAAFLNDQHGGFKPLLEPPFTAPVTRDQTGIIGMPGADGKPMLLVGSANYEDGLAVGPSVRQFDLGKKQIDDTIPGQVSSTGPLALVDLQGTGQLALFVGGRCVPGRYPEPASSLLLRQTAGGWELDDENSKTLRNVGLVSGAVWSDLDGDGAPDLILACEWGPLRVFKNEAGRLHEVTSALGLDKWTGWWNSVTTGDIDGDGKLDIIAGNWGLNSLYTSDPRAAVALLLWRLGRARPRGRDRSRI